ncbi:PREDICTED: GRF1-interacting factor 3-like [Populus euphratica]|uniref:GRF1-interacting factor 3-like n=1 Tax=Populus euphratica TaxID=75702 RepID=A0AAJ6V8C7_POPEU|nr:PREDICTED: GRF1-interacting factor 3-like [Populus euphratica]
MQQSPQQMLSITTEQIQKYLEENKQLIMAILENQNKGNVSECASYQAQLQQNLMYLARIADAQPQGTTMPSQMPPQKPAVKQEQYMQPSQVAMPQQPIFFNQKLPFQTNFQHEQQQQLPPHLQQQHFTQGQIRMRPGVTDQDSDA